MDWFRHIAFKWLLAIIYLGLIFALIFLFPAWLRPWLGGLYMLLALYSWWTHHTRAARELDVRPLSRWDVADYPRLQEGLRSAMAELNFRQEPYFTVVRDRVPNAMAIGGRRGIVAITTGALKLLSTDELLFVVGHELQHLASHDSLPAILGGAWLRLLGGITGVLLQIGSHQSGIVSGVAAVAGVVLDASLGVVGWAGAVTMAQRSRYEENQADLLGARLTSSATAISALRKLAAGIEEMGYGPDRHPRWSSAWIEQQLHASHPSLEARERFLLQAAERGEIRAS